MSFTLAMGRRKSLGPGVEHHLERRGQVFHGNDASRPGSCSLVHHLGLQRLPITAEQRATKVESVIVVVGPVFVAHRGVPDHSPEVGIHGLEPLSEQRAKSLGRLWTAGLKDVFLEHGLPPARSIDAPKQQVGDDPALGTFNDPAVSSAL